MNIHTLHIEHVMLLAVYTLLTVVNSWLYKGMKGVHWFSLYNVLALLGAVAVELRGQIPDVLSIVGGNLLVVGCYLCLFFSLTALFGRKVWHLYLQGVLVAVGVVTMVQYGWVHPDTRTRLIAYSLVLGLQQAHVAVFLYQKRTAELRRATNSMVLMLAGLALANAVRLLGVSLRGAPSDYLRAGDFLASIVVANTCLQCGLMVTYVWLAAALLRRDLQLQASTDPLTGLLNRRALEAAAERAIVVCRQAREQLTVMAIDLDGFKEINDSFGHAGGDEMLLAVSGRLRQELREGDVLARTGGDEFAVLLPRTPLATAIQLAEGMRQAVEGLTVVCTQVGSGPLRNLEMSVTASFGLAQIEDSLGWDQLLTRGDKALYRVKRAGGNQVSANVGSGSGSRLVAR